LKVRGGVYGRLMAGSGLAAAAANWTTSDLMGLGWLAGTLDMDTLARIPARAMDGVRGSLIFSEKQIAFSWFPGSFLIILIILPSSFHLKPSQRYGIGSGTSFLLANILSINDQNCVTVSSDISIVDPDLYA
jgi:hypothetical protein